MLKSIALAIRGLSDSLSHSKGVRDVVDRVPNRIQGNKDPQHVEEHQVHPHIHEVAAVEVDVAGEPLGAESHEAYNTH
jgi:hypothetical protein